MDSIRKALGKTYIRTDAWGNTDDIIRTILEADTMAPPFTRDFANSVRQSSIDDTCRTIWEWVKDNIKYQEDPEGKQDIQLPGALYERGSGDCKSMTLFTASVIKNLYGDIYRYRFISQDPQADYHHVYLVVRDEDGNDIILDCVEDYYDVEVPHAKQKDMKPIIGGRLQSNQIGKTTGVPLYSTTGSAASTLPTGSVPLQTAPVQQLPSGGVIYNQVPLPDGLDASTAPVTTVPPVTSIPVITAPPMSTGMKVGLGIAALLALYYFTKD